MREVGITGINIQWPWSELILSGEKTVETRSYPLPEKLRGQELALIETPGKLGAKNGVPKARIIGLVVFEGSFRYETKEDWVEDFERHLVREDDPLFGYSDQKEKWGWTIREVRRLSKPLAPPRSRGIVFARNCRIPL